MEDTRHLNSEELDVLVDGFLMISESTESDRWLLDYSGMKYSASDYKILSKQIRGSLVDVPSFRTAYSLQSKYCSVNARFLFISPLMDEIEGNHCHGREVFRTAMTRKRVCSLLPPHR